MSTLWLLRHPEPAVSPGLCYGRTDVSPDPPALERVVQNVFDRFSARLDPDSRAFSSTRQVQSIDPQPVRVISSPLRRCADLALALTARYPERFVLQGLDARLQEMDFGHWEGRTWSEIERGEIDAWAADPWHYRPGGGESAHDVRQRWRDFYANLGTGAGGRNLVITHAGVMRMALLEAGLLSESAMWLHQLAYGEPLALEGQGQER